MKMKPLHILSLATLLLASTVMQSNLNALPGGFSEVPATDEQALAAAKFAVAKHDAKLTYEAIEGAERQVVAGLNFRLTLKVTDNGKARRAEAVVWRKLDGTHQLTSWKWLDAAPAQPGLLKSEFIYDTAPFPSCHATTIAETGAGIAAAWFGGTAEGKPDVAIWSSLLVDGRWTAPSEVVNGTQPDGTRHPCWNPVLFQPKAGPLLLFYKVGPSPQLWWGEIKTSADGGRTWSAARRLPEGILGPIKNKPVQLANGDILCPTSNETPEKPSKWQVKFERTPDLGETWTKTAYLNDGLTISAIQPSILFLGGDRLLAVGRTRQARVFGVASDDAGRTWGEMTLTELPNPNSGTDAVTLRDGRHLLIYNHTARGRSPLNLAVSRDGKSWAAALVLEDEPKMEFSYPAIIQTSDGLVHATYTWKRQKVKHVVIDPATLFAREMTNGEWPK